MSDAIPTSDGDLTIHPVDHASLVLEWGDKVIYVDILSGPLALAINMTGATIVPVGGGLSNSLALLGALDRAVRARILRKFQRPLVVKAECLIEPGLVGAAVLGLAFAAHR